MINYKAGQELDDGLIGLLCKKAFSLFPERIEKSEQAHTNTVYVITLSGGKKVVLKVGPYTDVRLMHHEKNMMYTEVTVLQKMKNYTSIEVPEMYYYDASNTEFNGEYFFMEYLDGDNLADVRDALSKPAQAAIDEELGRNNRALNDIIGSSFGYYGRLKKRKDNWAEAFRDMMKDAMDDARYHGVQLPRGYDEDILGQLLEQDKDLFAEVKEPRLVHCDLWDGNVFIKNGRVQGIIDWERCLWGDPLMENSFRADSHNEAFFRGYGQRPFNDNEKVRIKWYTVYRSLIGLTEYYARGLVDEPTYSRLWHTLSSIMDNFNE